MSVSERAIAAGRVAALMDGWANDIEDVAGRAIEAAYPIIRAEVIEEVAAAIEAEARVIWVPDHARDVMREVVTFIRSLGKEAE